MLTSCLASHRQEDVDQGGDALAQLLASAVAREFSKVDDEVTHLGAHPIPFARAAQVRDPFLQHALHLQDRRHQPVDIESIEGAACGGGRDGPAGGRGRRLRRVLQHAERKRCPCPHALRTLPPGGDLSAPSDAHRLRLDIDDARRVFVDAENEEIVGQHRFEPAQPFLAHVAESGIVGATLMVVVVGDDGASYADLPKQVQARGPRRVFANLIDLVDR